jgi:hypothetical protein
MISTSALRSALLTASMFAGAASAPAHQHSVE